MAAAPREKGAAFALLVLLLRQSPAASDSAPGGPGSDRAALSALDRQEAQLARLESLVESISTAVARLESSAYRCSSSPVAPARRLSPAAEDAAVPPRLGGVSAIKHQSSWSERFQFVAAVRLDAEVIAGVVLPYLGRDGIAKYFAVGDAVGRTFVLSSAGDVAAEIPAPMSSSPDATAGSPVTAMLAYFANRRNECFLIVGHGDGAVVVHRLWEPVTSGDDWPTLSHAVSRHLIAGDRESPAILGLEFHQANRFRYIIVSDGGGRIRVYTESGTLYGTATASSRPLAFVRQRLLFLTETGAGSLDLRTMTVRETECEGLNKTQIASAYAFDPSERSKAYGFTAGGHLVHVVLLGDTTGAKCRLRATRRAEIDGPVAVLAAKGYLLASNREKIVVYNVSSHYPGRAGAPRPMFHSRLGEIKLLFSDLHGATAPGPAVDNRTPLIAGDREKLLVLGLGDGYVGVFRSKLPVYGAEANAVLWSTPVLVFLLLLVGIWHFYMKKKDVLGLTQDEAFGSSMAAAASAAGRMGSAVGGDRDRDRKIGDGSIGYDPRDVALRRPPRGYAPPPPRYGGAAGPSPYRGVADLTFRGQRLEKAPPGFPARRETVAVSTGCRLPG